MKKLWGKAFDEIDVPMLRRIWADLDYRLGYLRVKNGKHVDIYDGEIVYHRKYKKVALKLTVRLKCDLE